MTRAQRRGSAITAGFTYIEVLFSVVVLAGAVSSLGWALQSSRTLAEDAADMRVPYYMIQDGITWARSLARADPDQPNNFGPEAGEDTGTYDDVDDLNGLYQSPVTDRAGETFAAEWSRSFTVQYFDPANTSLPGGGAAPVEMVSPAPITPTNLMLLRVAVSRSGAEVASDLVLLWRIP